MKKYIFIIPIIIIIILLYKIYLLNNNYNYYKSSYEHIFDSVKVYKTKLDHYAASNKQIEVKYNSLKDSCFLLTNDLINKKEVIKELNIKLKRVSEISTSITETKIFVTVPVYDNHAEYNDEYNNIQVDVYKDSAKFNFNIKDSLYFVVHRIPKKFLFFKYGTKEMQINCVSKNPKTKIFYTDLVKFSK